VILRRAGSAPASPGALTVVTYGQAAPRFMARAAPGGGFPLVDLGVEGGAGGAERELAEPVFAGVPLPARGGRASGAGGGLANGKLAERSGEDTPARGRLTIPRPQMTPQHRNRLHVQQHEATKLEDLCGRCSRS
jgi:hypothetical protein